MKHGIDGDGHRRRRITLWITAGVAAGALIAGAIVAVPSLLAPTPPPSATVPLNQPKSVRPAGTFRTGAPAHTEPKLVKEIKADRTATTATWKAEDGSLVIREYTQPHFYQPTPDAAFVPISTKLGKSKDGSWRAANNSAAVTLKPIGAEGGNEQVTIGAGTIGFAPRGAKTNKAAPKVKGSTATYKGVWKSVDIMDEVRATGVKEDIVLTKPGTASSFGFDVSGATLQTNSDGGADLIVDGAKVGSIPAPTVITAKPVKPAGATASAVLASATSIADSGAALTVVDGHLEVSVSASWLASLPASAFPVTIDPMMEYDDVVASPLIAYSNTGATASIAQVGYDPSGQQWRTAAYFTTPIPPAPPAGDPPYQATFAYLGGFCVPQCSGIPGQHGLHDLYVRAETNPLGTPPTYATIPAGELAFTGIGAALGNDLAVQWRGKSGMWIGLDGNIDSYNDAPGTWAQFPGDNLFMDFNMSENVPATTITAPADGSVLSSTSPTLTADEQPDVNGYGVHYRFQLTTSADGTGSIIDSGWLDNPIYPVPAGALTDGVTYYATVQDTDWPIEETPDEGAYLAPADPKPAISFQVKERLGSGGPSATDTVGATPAGTTTPSSGAPTPGSPSSSETVNMVTGNLALSVQTPQMQTVSGPAGVSLNYNALESSVTAGHDYGVKGQYYLDPEHDHVFSAQPVGERVDPAVNLFGQYGTPPIGGIPNTALGYMVKWTGSILLPSGTWHLGGETTGGMRIKIDGSSSWYYDDWSGSQPNDSAGYGGATVTGGVRHTIEVDYWESYQGPAFQTWAQLWAEDSSFQQDIVPVYWLRPDNSSLPPGWSLSPDAGVGDWSNTVDMGSQVVLQSITGDTRTFTRTSAGLYTAPDGDPDYLSRNGQGLLQLSTPDNRLYVFNTDGTLASLTSTADDLHPTALQYGYSGTPTALTTITDPVSGRLIHLYYGGDSNCTAPTLGGQIAPDGQLCKIATWDGKATVLGYSGNGQIQTFENSGSTATFLQWDANDLLSSIRDQLGVAYFRTNPTGWQPECQPTYSEPDCGVDTAITYDSAGRVATVTQPAPALGAARPMRTYSYGDSTGSVLVAGQGAGATYSNRITYDTASRTVTSTNWGHAASTSVWDSDDRQIASIDPAGEQTSTVYDDKGNVTDAYGPAPAACFTGAWPAGASTAPAPATGYLPAANPPETAGCGVEVPRNHTGYDEGITGLAATYWANGQFAGAAALHGPASSSSGFCGTADWLCGGWDTLPVGTDSNGQFSVRAKGTLQQATDDFVNFELEGTGQTVLTLDGQVVLDLQADDATFQQGQFNVFTLNYPVLAGAHDIEVDYTGYTPTGSQNPNGFAVFANNAKLSNGVLHPDYGLATSTTDPDGKVTATSYTNATIGAQYGLPTAVTADPGGLALTTSTTYETPGAGHYLRTASSTLPGGTTTDYQYYGGPAGPIAAVCGVTSATPQGGQASTRLDPAPAPGQPRRETQYVYDAAGRAVGSRVGPSTSITTVGWDCTSYDDRGRITGQTWPAFDGAPARTVTYTYAVGGNPLVSSVADSTSPITVSTVVDLLGRVTSYTDGTGRTTTTSYDQAGRVSGTSGPGGTFTDSYLVTGELLSVSDSGGALATAAYDGISGRLTSVGFGNGLTASIGYDSYGRQDEVDYTSSAGSVAGDRVDHSVGGRFASEIETAGGPPVSMDYSYDGAGRLTAAGVPGQDGAYSYDASDPEDGCVNPQAGKNTNRSSVTLTPAGGPAVTTRSCFDDADRLVSTTDGSTVSTDYAYDAHGNQTHDNGTAITWDASDRMTSATNATGSIEYVHDPLDRIATQTTADDTVGYLYGGFSDSPVAATDASGDVTTSFISLPGGVSLTRTADGGTWSISDLRGNTMMTLDDTLGIVGSAMFYDPWGELVGNDSAQNGTATADFGGFGASGKLTDAVTGFVTLGARVFNPAEARFLSVDPIYGGCANAYTYVHGDPLTEQDLTGQSALGSCLGTHNTKWGSVSFALDREGRNRAALLISYTVNAHQGSLTVAVLAASWQVRSTDLGLLAGKIGDSGFLPGGIYKVADLDLGSGGSGSGSRVDVSIQYSFISSGAPIDTGGSARMDFSCKL